jgi:hypothetical protein
MTEQLEQTLPLNILTNEPVQAHPVTDAEILAYLRHSTRFAEIAIATERETSVLFHCNQLGIEISDDEWQAAGDAFRMERKLWGNAETSAWLEEQRITRISHNISQSLIKTRFLRFVRSQIFAH